MFQCHYRHHESTASTTKEPNENSVYRSFGCRYRKHTSRDGKLQNFGTTRRVSPFFRWQVIKIVDHTVDATSGRDAASCNLIPLGMGNT